MRQLSGSIALIVLLPFMVPSALPAAETDELLATIGKVGPEGKGHEEAATAWKTLVAQGLDALLPTLDAMDQADFRAQNWLRSAVNAIVEDARQAKKPLPAKKLEAFVQQTKHNGAARKMAYDLLVSLDPQAPDRLLPGMIRDPGSELRREAIARKLNEAEALLKKNQKKEAKGAYQKLLADARDQDQVEAIAKALKEMGAQVDLPSHFGLIQRWALIAPFDSTNGIGYEKVYPPEKDVDLSESYTGKGGMKAQWLEHTTKDSHGMVDLNEVLGKIKGAVAYAHAVIDSPEKQEVEIRAGCITAIKIFLNGKELFGREEYHHGMSMDQHTTTAILNKGRNELLLKICQNEQTERWAQKWQFQARICDAIGGAVPFKVVTPSIKAKEEGAQ